ncbi:hypothetical protein PFISCL1PPCAC_1560 [Pristionchus fissidentatus]|uniref:C3H1-type domain-containing protein n=1 Tax=Pristionchus fissidentatus TaxID=1538716 RepID=A0AAV5UU95_9BILA|nr:hypothetical protein PFISCL1PPCAC_1560 [Pristionchus fissidentatus]
MAAKDDNFLNVLRLYTCRPGFVNSYWWALQAANIHQCCQKDDNFQIPLFILEEELEKESDTHDNLATGIPSANIREFLIHLLRLALPESKISYGNYNEILREFLGRDYLLRNPLAQNRLFHELSSEIKLWIFHVLLQNSSRVVRRLTPFGSDSEGNEYFLVDGGLLYLQPGNRLDSIQKKEYDGVDETVTVEGHLRQRPQWKLLAETREDWTKAEALLKCFGGSTIANAIGNRIEEAMKMKTTKEQQSEERLAFMRLWAPITLMTENRKSRTVLNRPRTLERNVEDDCSAFDFQEMRRIFPEDPPAYTPHPHYQSYPQSNYRSVDRSKSDSKRLKTFRCMHFPQCPRSDEECHFIHPIKLCRNFSTPSCPGEFCFFLHPDCPNDGRCRNPNCPYEHRQSVPTLLRRSNSSKNNENPSMQNIVPSRTSHSTNRSPSRNSRQLRIDSPTRTGNIRSRSQRRILSRSSSNSSAVSHKEQKPQSCCYFFPRCSKSNCEFWHRKEKCNSFPNCSGMSCLFLHGECPQDRRCDNEWCPYEHYKQTPPRAVAIFKRASEKVDHRSVKETRRDDGRTMRESERMIRY